MHQKKIQQSKIDFAENNYMKIGEATSAIGDQRADGLAGEIVAFQEGKHAMGIVYLLYAAALCSHCAYILKRKTRGINSDFRAFQ